VCMQAMHQFAFGGKLFSTRLRCSSQYFGRTPRPTGHLHAVTDGVQLRRSLSRKTQNKSFTENYMRRMSHSTQRSSWTLQLRCGALQVRTSTNIGTSLLEGHVEAPRQFLWETIVQTPRKMFASYRLYSKRMPFMTSFALCFSKGLLADSLAQLVIERRTHIDGRRVGAMALFSGSFTGCAYHFIFNRIFPLIFGMSKNIPTIAAQVGADAFAVFPFLYMPTYLVFDELLRCGSFFGVPSRWCTELKNSMRQYMKIWPPTMLCVFALVPTELRVSFIASVSFVWLIILSVISH